MYFLILFERSINFTITFQVKRTLFGLMNPYPQKKVITFNKHSSDFSFNVNYADMDHLDANELKNIGSFNLTKVALSGVHDAIVKTEGPNIESKGIKAHFAMDDSGLLKLLNVELVAEKTLSPEEQQEEEEESSFAKLGSTISKLFGGDGKKEKLAEKDSEQDAETEHSSESEQTTEQSAEKLETNSTAKGNATESGEPKVLKPKIVILKEKIETSEDLLSVPILSEDQFKASVNKLEALNKQERERTRRETALNNLEAFVIDTQSKLGMKEYSECGTPDEIEKIMKACSEASDWLYDDGSDATAKQYEDKLAALKKSTNGIYSRHWEHNERSEVLIAFKGVLNNSRTFLENAKNFTKDVNPEKDIFTDVEINVLTKTIEDVEKWVVEMTEEQNKLKKHEEVKLTVKSITEKMSEVDREVKYLLNKLKIWRPKKIPVPKENVTEGSGTPEEVIENPPLETSGSGQDSGEPEINIESPTEAEETTSPDKTSTNSSDEHNEL